MTNKYKILLVNFKEANPQKIGIKKPPFAERLAELDYDDVMKFLKKNFQLSRYNQNRVAKIDINGYQVTINSLKIRTFIESYIEHKDACENEKCDIKPAYFALERAKGKRKSKHITAYLTLYGINKCGEEEEFTHDHTLARCFGGKNSLSNTTMMCKSCNNAKSRLESRVHHKTLTILKAYLEDTTGKKANPSLVLQQLRAGGMNKTSLDTKVRRIRTVELKEVINAIRDPKKQSLVYKGYTVKTKGLRLKTFSKNKEPCCENPECNIKATHFAVEKVISNEKEFGKRSFHLNMYGKDKNDQEIMFFHHHFFETNISGVPEQLVTKTLCKDCKKRAMLEEAHEITQTLEKPLLNKNEKRNKNDNVNRSNKLERNRHISVTKNRKNKIIRMINKTRKTYNFKDVNDFIQYCNEMGNTYFKQKQKGKKGKRNNKIHELFPEFSEKGIRWLNKIHNESMTKNNNFNDHIENNKKVVKPI